MLYQQRDCCFLNPNPSKETTLHYGNTGDICYCNHQANHLTTLLLPDTVWYSFISIPQKIQFLYMLVKMLANVTTNVTN